MSLLGISTPLFAKVERGSPGQEIGRVSIVEFIFVCSIWDACVLLLSLPRNGKCLRFVVLLFVVSCERIVLDVRDRRCYLLYLAIVDCRKHGLLSTYLLDKARFLG